jgi:TATA-binding protein-associated factor Taf7
MEVQERKEARSRRGEFARHSTIIGGAMAELSSGLSKREKQKKKYGVF